MQKNHEVWQKLTCDLGTNGHYFRTPQWWVLCDEQIWSFWMDHTDSTVSSECVWVVGSVPASINRARKSVVFSFHHQRSSIHSSHMHCFMVHQSYMLFDQHFFGEDKVTLHATKRLKRKIMFIRDLIPACYALLPDLLEGTWQCCCCWKTLLMICWCIMRWCWIQWFLSLRVL